MYDVIIIGAGPAGLSAAIYSSRRALKTLVLGIDVGGQIAKSNEIGNYPGFEKISGVELAMKFKSQAETFGAEIKIEQVKSITKNDESFTVETIANNYQTKTVILAFGKQPKELDVPGEEKYKGKGVTYCATCDAPFFRNKTVVVVGGGNSALDAALLSAKYANKVYLIHRRDIFTGEQILVDKVKSEPKIEAILNETVNEIKGESIVKSIVLGSGKEIDTDGIIVEVGYVISRALVEDLVEIDEKNQIVINEKQETSARGIFAAGDLTTTPYKQVVISAGEGAKAALTAYNYILEQEGKKGPTIDWH